MHMTNFLLALLLLVEAMKVFPLLNIADDIAAIRSNTFKTYLKSIKYVF